MYKNPSRFFDFVICLGLSFFLILGTVDGILTTKLSLEVILFLRRFSWVGMLGCSLLIFLVWIRSFQSGYDVALPLLLLLIWGGILTRFFSGNEYGLSDFRYIMVASIHGVCGAYLLRISPRWVLDLFIIRFLWLYGVVIFLLLIISGGFNFKYPPAFIFPEISAMHGVQVVYSQGASKLFGLLAILYALGLTKSNGNFQRLVFGFMLLGSVFLCLLGGARGESLFATVLVGAILLWRYRLRFLVLVIVFSLGLNFLVKDWSWLEDFVIFQRYSVLAVSQPAAIPDVNIDGKQDPKSELQHSEYGYRDTLLKQSYRLILDKPICLISGCGFGYFQKYYNYPIDMYPHNELVEFLITHGAVLTLLTIGLVGGGAWIFFKGDPKLSPLALIYMYLLLLALKGGTVFSNGLFIALSLFFTSQTYRFIMDWILRRHHYKIDGGNS